MLQTLARAALWRQLLWKVLCLLLATLYIAFIVRDYRASLFAASQDLSAVERAVTLDPGNADYWDRAGFYLIFVEHRPELAISRYRMATTLNPYVADYWLDLASAYGLAGDDQERASALNHALAAEPKTPRVAQNVANAFLARGDFPRAFKIFRTVLQDDPSQEDAILETCWQATENVERMSDVLPPAPRTYLALMNILIANGDVEASDKLWSRLLTLQKSFDPALAMSYVEYLMAQHRAGQAMTVWNDVGRLTPSFSPYLTGPGNLIVNGSFEGKILDRGFDWRYERSPGVRLSVDGNQFHSGSHSLLIAFDGQAAGDDGISQIVAVDENRQYSFSAYVKSESLLTAHGPHFAIGDAYTQRCLFLSEEFSGSSDWRLVRGLFNTDATTTAVSVKLVSPSGARISGRLWIDDVSIAGE